MHALLLHGWYLLLAVLLFAIVNWIGEHSSSFGYLQLSLNIHEASAPLFNFVLKALAPTVYLVITAATCYALHLDFLVQGIWLVAAYYFGLRVFFNLAIGRAALLDWAAISRQTVVGVGVAYLAYKHLIVVRRTLFPGVQSIGNQIWVIVTLFIYAVLNNVRNPSAKGARRKKRYLKSRLDQLRIEYGDVIDNGFPERYMELVTYAILIYETFNRPRLVRLLESALFPWFSRTLGPMQVKTDTRLSERESVVKGVGQLRESFATTNAELLGKRASRYTVIRSAVAKYNRDEGYIAEVFQVLHTLWAQVAPEYRVDFETMHDRPAV